MMNAALNSNEMYGGSHIVNQNQKESSNVDGSANKKKKGFFARINLTLIVGVLVMVVFILLLLLIVLICLYNALNQSNQGKTTPVRSTVTGRIPTQSSECGIATTTPLETSLLTKQQRKKRMQLGRIMNGEVAAENAWPWVVSIRLRSGSKIGEHVCGGSLIFSNLVITAAHCVYKHMPEKLVVLAGITNLTAMPPPAEQVYYVADFIYHSGFDRFEIINDIAILRLERPVLTSKSVSVICLPPPDEDHSAIYDRDVVVVGWGSISGTDSQSSLSPTLKQSTLKVLNTKSICIKSNTNNNNNYCALDEANSSNACYGDSGGPMMHYRNGRWYLYGLTSFVLTQAAKCYPSLPSFYTIIPKYLDWIGNIITTLSSSV